MATDAPDVLLRQIYEALNNITLDLSGPTGGGGLRAEVAKVKRFGERNRVWIFITCAGLVLDLVLSVGFFVIAHRIGQQSNAATVNCRAANELGSAQKELWAPLLVGPQIKGEPDRAYQKRLNTITLPPKKETQTEQEYADTVKFRETILKLAEPRECHG